MKKHKLTGQGGKGSARRNSNEQAYADNWDLIFGKNKKEDKKQSQEQINLGLHINEQTQNKTK